jgi:predicted CXXCH cytochrome family protein
VYNTTGYPSQPLAGGNFYYVAQGGACAKGDCDEYGHNVYGISNADSNLTKGAPGNENCGGLTSPCHKTLAAPPGAENYNRGGCQGCHYNVYHHNDNGIYRFLSTGHESGGSAAYYVEGDEDSDWEQTTATHNWYKGVVGPVNGGTLATTHSISTFCGGCHKDFHREAYIGGTSSPWIRHPTDIALPTTSEYSAYSFNDPPTYSNYKTEAPVAWTDPKNTGNRGTPIVMCLSCHRPHGTDQPDMLRWDYDNMIAGGGTNSTGCFTCHTTKDDGS